MARERRLHGRWFDLLATVLIGVVVTGAALVPAVTANSGERTTVRGDVSLNGTRLPFFPVGFWVPDDPSGGGGVLASTRTDANGVFTMDVPITNEGYAFAGTVPNDSRTLLDFDGRSVVRGTIGKKAAEPVSSPLYQGWEPATGKSLAGGTGQLHFALQQAGRVAGGLPLPGAQVRAVQVRRLDGSVVESPKPDAAGRWTSGPLVPGGYAVALVPVAPLLPVAVPVQIEAGATATAALPAPVQGAEIDGVVRSDPGVALQGVPVLLQQDGRVVATTTADGAGAYRFTGVAAGSYGVEVGRFADTGSTTPSPAVVDVPIPGRSPAPSPSPTLTSPAPSPAASAQVLQPVQRTADAVLPATADVIVPDGLGQVGVVSQARAAARVGGTVAGAGSDPVQVVVEEAKSGRVLRVAAADSAGRWSVAGLTPGQRLTVWAVTRPADVTQARMGRADGVASSSASGVDVVIDRPAASLLGTVPDAATGTVKVGDDKLLLRTSGIDASGAYAVQGLVPGLFPAVVSIPDRLDADPVAVTVTQDGAPRDLQRGPRASTFVGWFLSSGAGVPIVSGTATTADGTTMRFGGADRGHVRVPGLRPGTYAYDAKSFGGTVPALDGPWWFDAPAGTFSLSDGAITDVGPIVLHLRAR